MAPSPTRLHQEFVVELVRQVANALLGRSCRVYVAPFDVRLPKDDEADARVDTVVHWPAPEADPTMNAGG
jgi:hypothetical protein